MQIRSKHNSEADLKLINDPIQDFSINLTPSLMKFSNIGTIVDMYLSKQVDVKADDLGLSQKLVS